MRAWFDQLTGKTARSDTAAMRLESRAQLLGAIERLTEVLQEQKR